MGSGDFHGYIVALALPLLNLIGLWALSAVRWPKLDQQSAKLGEAFD